MPPEQINALIALSGGSIGFALKILATETLPLYQEMLSLLEAMPHPDVARLHKLADQIGRKADAESFEVLTALLIEHLRLIAHEEVARDAKGSVGTVLDLWDKTRTTLAAAETGNLDRKLAFITAMTEIRAAL